MAKADHPICRSPELTEGAMRAAELDGLRVLVARVGGVCQAVGATCPHAGAPLDQGVLRNGVVVCPWHKAAFRVATGERLEPPALDDLPRWPVREEHGQVIVTVGGEPEPAEPVAASPVAVGRRAESRCMALIGAGAAGAAAAQTLREAGFAGRVVLIGREDRLPYDRTVLSKYTLSGQQGGEKSPLQDAAFYTSHRIERLARDVAALDPAARAITFADGGTLQYDAALLATGGVPRPLPLPGAALPGVFLLRTQDDAEAIVRAARQARRAVILGSGYIAMEAAAGLRERGLEVTVAAPQQAPFERQLGAEVGNAFRRLHERKGVAFRLGRQATAVLGHGQVRGVALDDGSSLDAELVVAGLGVTPATGILRGTTIREDGGVAVDAALRMTEGLYAAGDIAAFPLYGDGEPIRVEHWRVAQQHGRVAALNMLGGAVAYRAAPYFWTIQYMKRLDYVGHAARWDRVVIDGDLDRPEFLALYLCQGRVTAIAGCDRDRAMAEAVGLMTERHDWSDADLLRELAAA